MTMLDARTQKLIRKWGTVYAVFLLVTTIIIVLHGIIEIPKEFYYIGGIGLLFYYLGYSHASMMNAPLIYRGEEE